MKYEEATEKCMKNEHFFIEVGNNIQWCAFCGSIKINDKVKVPDTYIQLYKLSNFASGTR